MLSILIGIMFPESSVPVIGQAMPQPDAIDEAILACCKPQFRKVARIIVDVATALEVPMDADMSFIADRIKALANSGDLESQGNLDRWQFSEIRLPEK